eukprot:CAMPEP_0196717030 /NCGR_PEP_ID=MMETSP1091-20130531/455_1 /TAXON_ID=302021 /ORGANISM="Rhodomonas sp., Strain CCMP768" /LENGTH=51 /DNA_ID=CAMNT_0042057249 /DNA_START=10 /DNA_END=165 /DNA_ORIENTATION=+
MSTWLRRLTGMAEATKDDIPTKADGKHMTERFNHFMLDQDNEGSYGLANFH